LRPGADGLMDGGRYAHEVGTYPWVNASCALI
jgi:hypothetical protein